MTGLVYSANREMAGERQAAQDIVCDVSGVHVWNPALDVVRTRDRAAVGGKVYSTRVRGLLPATLVYTSVLCGCVAYELRALGATERGWWAIREPSPGSLLVTHVFEHDGVVPRAMRGAFRHVAGWRLERLEAVLRGSSIASSTMPNK